MMKWRMICQVSDADQPGILARITNAMAQRGVSLGEVSARRTDHGPEIELTLSADERLRDWLVRRLACDPAITAVSFTQARGG